MKKALGMLLLLTMLLTEVAAQSFTLTVVSNALDADTLRLQCIKRVKITDEHQRFEGEILYKDVATAACAPKAVFTLKKGLEAGYYRVTADTALLFELLVSEKKKQKITVTVGSNGVALFDGSEENRQYQKYLAAQRQLSRSMDSLNRIFQDAQGTMPQYMLQDLAMRLSAQAEELMRNHETLCQQMTDKLPGSLLASLIQFDQPLPPLPSTISSNEQYLAYSALHAFDNFPYTDGRMSTTPAAMNRLLAVCSNLFYMNPQHSPAIADTLLTRWQANADNYHAFFTVMETAFGTIGVSFWTEEIYLTMLKNALAYPQLEERRQNYYQQLYELQSKNLPGSQLPDIPILWSDDSRSSLHAVEAEYTLLYLQNPDCHTCTAVRGYMAANPELDQAVKSGRLTVVTLYFEKDEQLWRRYLSTKADPRWRHGWDYQGAIDSGSLFDLRAIPVIFLLDKDKKVIVKNLPHYDISNALKAYGIIP
jgi:hypothetical protein